MVPTVGTTAKGVNPAARSRAIAAASSPGRIRNWASTGMRTQPADPVPITRPAFSTLEWASAEA